MVHGTATCRALPSTEPEDRFYVDGFNVCERVGGVDRHVGKFRDSQDAESFAAMKNEPTRRTELSKCDGREAHNA